MKLSKKQYMGKAMKEWSPDDGHDLIQKNRIAVLLRNNTIRHYPVFDRTIFINKETHKWQIPQPNGYTSQEELWKDWHTFVPDLLFPLKNLIIECDGKFHFETTKGVKQTNHRNEWYEKAGIRLIWYYTPFLNKMTDEELFQDLKAKL